VPVISPDLYPTILAMAGLKDVPDHRTDGVSLTPVLRQNGGLERDCLYWHYPHYQLYQQGGTTPYGAIRHGDWKLIETYDDMRVELYNLAEDIGESRDLAARLPEKTAELRGRLQAWRTQVGAQMPTRNPAYDPARPEHVPRKPAGKAKR
jgi:arylsulfatase A-like enzyme